MRPSLPAGRLGWRRWLTVRRWLSGNGIVLVNTRTGVKMGAEFLACCPFKVLYVNFPYGQLEPSGSVVGGLHDPKRSQCFIERPSGILKVAGFDSVEEIRHVGRMAVRRLARSENQRAASKSAERNSEKTSHCVPRERCLCVLR